MSAEGYFFAVMIWCFFKPEAGTALRRSAECSERRELCVYFSG